MSIDLFHNELAEHIFHITAEIDLQTETVCLKYVKGKPSQRGKTVSFEEAKMLFTNHVVFDTNNVTEFTMADLRRLYRSSYRKKSFFVSRKVKPNILKRYILSIYPQHGKDKLYATVSESESTENTITFLSKRTEVVFNINDLLYIGYGNHCVEFYKTDNSHDSLFNVSFNDVADILLYHNNFIRSYKNCIVNMDMIEKVSSNSFTMKNKAVIPIPKRRYKDILHTYEEYNILKSNTFDI